MNYFDIIFIVILLACGYEGFRKGLLRQAVDVVGSIIVLYLSFILMNPLGNLFLKWFPIFSLKVIDVKLESLSILLYQIIAFIIISVILYGILKLILNVTGLFAKIVSLNGVLAFPTKILGGILGLVTGYIALFIILLVFSFPLSSKFSAYRESKVKDYVIDNKIFMTSSVKKVSKSVDEVYTLTSKIDEDRNRIKNSKKYNADVMNIMLKNKIISIDTVDELIKDKKITSDEKLENVLIKYRKEN